MGLQGNYGHEADVWSTGVIIYILLCGLPPFHGSTEKQIFQRIQHAPIDFEEDPWPHVSAPAKDLVQWCVLPAALSICLTISWESCSG